MKKVSKYSSLLLTIFIFCPGNIFAQPIWTKQNPYQMKNSDPPAMNKQPGGGYQYQHSPFASDTVFEDNYPAWYSGFEPDPRISEGISPTWVREYGTPTDPSVEQFNAVVVDNTGNIYVGGQSEEPFPRYSIGILAKYDTNGNLQWLVREKGIGPIDRVYVDAEGNLYAGSGDVMMKFDSQGVKQWSIDTCGSRTDVDPIGNVFSTRSHDLAPEGSIREIVTRKYDFDGHHQWTAYYSFKNGSVNDPTDIAADGLGGVVVTGGSDLTGISPSTITVKYGSDGSEQWIVNYNAGTGGKVTIDKSGAVYLSITNNEGKHYTIKYNSSGIYQWLEETTGNVRKIATDEGGNVMVVLEDAGRWRMAKYDQNGAEKWQQIYDKTNYTEDPRGLTIDNQGNVYVAGTTTLDSTGQSRIIVLCCDSGGINKWIFESQDTTSCAYGYPLTVDANGSVYIPGGKGSAWGWGFDKALIFKLGFTGTQQWLEEYDTPGIYRDAAHDMDLDSQGNIYICGTRTYGRFSQGDRLSILKYDPLGNLLWKHVDEHASISYLSTAKMKVIGDGSACLLYIESYYDISQNTLHLNNIDPDGNPRWSVKYQPPANVGLEPKEILFNLAGDIYVIVNRSGPDTTSAILLQKYSSNGNLVWLKELLGKQVAGNRCAILDNAGELYIIAIEPNQSGSFMLLKINSSGLEQWNKSYVAPQGYSCGSSSIVSDESSSVYITGGCWSESNAGDFLTVKYDSDGNQEWVKQYDGPDHGADYAQDILIDVNGNVFVGGTSDSSGNGLVSLVSYDDQGNQRWVKQTPGGWWGMNIDDTGSLNVIGYDEEIISIKYSNDGQSYWNNRFYLFSYNWIQTIQVAFAFDQHDHLYVTANNYAWRGFGAHKWIVASIITTLQYDLNPNPVENPSNGQTETFVLEQNYPNPFNPSTTIEFSIPKSELVTLKIYNLLGQEVASLMDEKKLAGKHKVQFDGSGLASGVYFYQLRTDSFVSTKKFIMLR